MVVISLFDIVGLVALSLAGVRLWRGTGSPTTRGLMVASLAWLAWLWV